MKISEEDKKISEKITMEWADEYLKKYPKIKEILYKEYHPIVTEDLIFTLKNKK